MYAKATNGLFDVCLDLKSGLVGRQNSKAVNCKKHVNFSVCGPGPEHTSIHSEI